MRKLLLPFLILALTFSCAQDCPENINTLPMYGGKKKCPEQIKSDNDFFQECDKNFSSRKEAAQYFVGKGWEYFYKNDFDSSMKRFNQAWLLDKTNAEVFWGFGNLLGLKRQPKESIPFFEKSIELNPNNSKVYESLSTSHGQLFYQTKKIEHLNLTIDNLKKAIKLDKTNASLYGKLSGAYAYFTQKDSLRKYMKIAENLDPKVVDPEVRKIANEK